jgi:hypothetical protein
MDQHQVGWSEFGSSAPVLANPGGHAGSSRRSEDLGNICTPSVEGMKFVAWLALIFGVIASAIAAAAFWHAREAHRLAVASTQRLDALATRATWADADSSTGIEAGQRQLIAATLADGERLSGAGQTIVRALSAGREAPTPADYARVEQSADRFTASIGRLRAPEHGDLVRELTDELVTLHHSLLTEIRQHEAARYPFVGARDSALAVLVLSKFDAELRRLRRYGQTGHVPEIEQFPVDFDTVRFIPRDLPPKPPPE